MLITNKKEKKRNEEKNKREAKCARHSERYANEKDASSFGDTGALATENI